MQGEDSFRRYLKAGGRSSSAVQRAVLLVNQFAYFLKERQFGKQLDEADPDDLKTLVDWIESRPKSSAKTHLWAIYLYYKFTDNEIMSAAAEALRAQRLQRTPFPLKDFYGVNPDLVAKLAAVGIKDTEQMLKAGCNSEARRILSEYTGIPTEAILELVKLSDLARVPGIKSARARLYYEVGVDTTEKLAQCDPEALEGMLVAFVQHGGYEGIAPLPAEARTSVKRARELPKIVEYPE